MELISVIVPIYKVEKYLNQCIESIVNQTYQNLEIILVDDGSTDNCPAMCDEWAAKDNRIRVIHKINGGLSEARNVGLDMAKGKYIAFVDSDDWIDVCLLENLLKALVRNGAQIAACKVVKVYEKYFEEESINDEKEVFSSAEALATLLKGRDFQAVVWNKLYQKEMIGEIRFPVGVLHEDEFFTYRVMANASKLVLVSKYKYYYRQRPGSIMDKWSIQHLDILEALRERTDFLKEKFPELWCEGKYTFFLTCLFSGKKLLKSCHDTDVRIGIQKILQYSTEIRFTGKEFTCLGFRKTIIVLKGRILFWKLGNL